MLTAPFGVDFSRTLALIGHVGALVVHLDERHSVVLQGMYLSMLQVVSPLITDHQPDPIHHWALSSYMWKCLLDPCIARTFNTWHPWGHFCVRCPQAWLYANQSESNSSAVRLLCLPISTSKSAFALNTLDPVTLEEDGYKGIIVIHF